MHNLSRVLAKCFKRSNFKVRSPSTASPQPSFWPFLALPLEIRERIYKLCCDNDRAILEEHFISATPPPEPAIACTCHQLRREALPVFYQHYRFPVPFGSGALINRGYLPPEQEWRAARWYHRLAPAKVRMIRRLELYYCFGRFEVDFDLRRNAFSVDQTAWGARRLVDVQPKEERERLLALVSEALAELIKWPGVGCFTAADFDRLELDAGMDIVIRK